jgi:2-iminobutanoate/2-iminopropanoate deaminase
MRSLRLLFLALAFTGSGVLDVQAQQPSTSSPPTATVEYLAGRGGSAPLSEAVRVGSILYLSGQLGVGATGTLVTDGIKAETKQVLENIRTVLEKNGSGMDRVVKCTVMLADIADRAAMNEVYVTFFPKDRLPTRSTFGTTGLALGARVEIECMAALK